MNNAFNLYDLRDFKASGSDLVAPWIDGLLDKKDASGIGQAAQILPYPIEKILTPEPVPLETVSEVKNAQDIHIVSQTNVLPLHHAIAIDLEKEVSYFTFISGKSIYALPTLSVNEIIKYKTPVDIFSRKAGHLGIIFYRKRMMPVYDFSIIIINEPAEVISEEGMKARFKYIVVCIYANKFFGLAVSEIKNITKVKNKNLIPSSSFKFKNSNNISSDVFEGEEGKFYSIIDIKSVYNYLTS